MPVRPFTASWILRYIRESPIKIVLMQLRVWAPNCQEKLDELLVKKIRNLPVDQALNVRNSMLTDVETSSRKMIDQLYWILTRTVLG